MRAFRKAPFLARRGPVPAVGWLVALFTLVGAWLRLEGLGDPSLWWDEIISLDKALLPLRELWPTLAAWGTGDAGIELFPPLYHALLHGVLALSPGDEALRLVGVAFGVASIPAVFALGRELFDRRAGLLASFFLATSTYHIHYSREARPYSLFILLGVVALTALHAAVVRGRGRAWLVYAPTMAALFYSSYMASTMLAAHGLFTLAVLAPQVLRGGPERARALGVLRLACGAWLFAAVAYLPWLPNQLVTLAGLRDTPRTAGLPPEFFLTAANEFAGFAYAGPLPVGAVFALLSLAGAWTALATGHGRQLALLAFWTAMPALGAVAAKTGIDVTSRYFVTAYLSGLLLAALALTALGARLVRSWPLPDFAREGAGLVASLVVASLAAWPSLAWHDAYLRREPAGYKRVMAWVERHAGRFDRLLVSSGRGLGLVSRWYLEDPPRDLSDFTPAGYKRAVVLTPQGRNQGFAGRAPLVSTPETDVHAVGLASLAPVLLAPDATGEAVYRAELAGPGFWRDVWRARNLAPDMGGGALALLDARRPGEAVFAFTAPAGMTLGPARVRAVFAGVFKAAIACDSRVGLQWSADGAAWQALTEVGAADFAAPGQARPAGQTNLTRTFELPAEAAGGRQLFVRALYGPVTSYGAVELAGLDLSARLDGPTPGPAELAVQALEHAAANNALLPWRPGESVAGRGRLVAFAHEGARPWPGAGSPADLAAFQACHPGLDPVLTIPPGAKRPAYSLFDPGLAAPLVSVGPAGPASLALDPDQTRTVRALRVAGTLNAPTLTLDGAQVALPVRADGPAVLEANLGGQARLRLAPLFNRTGAGPALTLGENLRRPEAEDCLTCAEARPCSLTLTARSDWPVTALRLDYYPRVVADLAGRNRVTASVSLDGGPFVALDEYRPPATGRWAGLKSRRSAVLALPKPARDVAVRFDLSGPDAQLWSAPDARLNLELTLDASRTAPVHPGGPVIAVAADQPLAVELLADPIHYPDALLPRR